MIVSFFFCYIIEFVFFFCRPVLSKVVRGGCSMFYETPFDFVIGAPEYKSLITMVDLFI